MHPIHLWQKKCVLFKILDPIGIWIPQDSMKRIEDGRLAVSLYLTARIVYIGSLNRVEGDSHV